MRGWLGGAGLWVWLAGWLGQSARGLLGCWASWQRLACQQWMGHSRLLTPRWPCATSHHASRMPPPPPSCRPTNATQELLDKLIYRVETENGWDQALFNECIYFPSSPANKVRGGLATGGGWRLRRLAAGKLGQGHGR